jgi:uncharacterized protein
MNKEVIIEKLKFIKPQLEKKYTVNEIALFGSFSRNEETKESDIDIMVDHQLPLGFKFLDLVYELESIFDLPVQVVSKKGIKQKYFEAIKKDLIYA